MPIPAFDDPRDFLDDFGVDVVTRASRGTAPAVTVRGVFDEKYVDVKIGSADADTPGVTRCRCMQVDVAALKKYDTAEIEGVLYYLEHDPAPDGHGYSWLSLALDTDGP